ncbi:family 16 glycosylhydrolase [Flammeovirga yaeyamensis]|uniref:Family 16 glycosylhydrolase n=1 Tax=Flammeovirga yaeyamensis TaxID=367791 RepID=A0AAX1N7Q6_9BACT|nr:family 16 glycosylhydrolase [Flammeovirga yaeyamensis]MBB3697858.1 beta-glucanase (GH16 family) [Flammeovirga yaeyamensis]NMF35787.1 family 16 glycosylhydrolase [Flammeovirga yaeyamensis]QWG03261.1 family 16 glycosylhydrolase [Flammeovirga yaeyamensis]
MKKYYFLLLSFLIYQTSFAQNDCYELVWADEFEVNGAPDANKWGYDIGGSGWGNNEDQYYTDKLTNAQVIDGKLVITARKENFGGKAYTSARLVSKDKGDWLYGKVVVRAKIPTGQGTWPAIWMLSTDWEYGGWPASGEIDIMEHVGYDPNVVHGTVHTEAYNHMNNTQKGEKVTIATATTAYHDYVLEWDENSIKVGYDDTFYFNFTKGATYQEWPFDKRFHLLLNIAMGGSWGGVGGPTDDSALPAKMEIEYVRVYQKTVGDITVEGDVILEKNNTYTYFVKGMEGNVTWTVPEGMNIVSGQGTSTIEVEVTDDAKGGEVNAEIVGNCSTYNVKNEVKVVVGKPQGEQISFPATIDNTIKWSVSESFASTFTLEKDNEDVLVTFDVKDPSTNPYIDYEFDEIYDFSAHQEFSVVLKNAEGKEPDALRIELLDGQGNTINSGFGRWYSSELQQDCNFWRYTHTFDQAGTQVSGVRMYINYGIFSNAKKGGVIISDIVMSQSGLSEESLTDDGDCGGLDNIVTSIDSEYNNKTIYPNPVRNGEELTVGEDVRVQLFNLIGKKVFEGYSINGKLLIDGIEAGHYIIVLKNENNNIYKKIIIQ